MEEDDDGRGQEERLLRGDSRAVNAVVLNHLIALASDEHASAQVRATVSLKLDELKKWMTTQSAAAKDEGARAQFFFAASLIERFEKNPAEGHLTAPAALPDGDPIGSDEWE